MKNYDAAVKAINEAYEAYVLNDVIQELLDAGEITEEQALKAYMKIARNTELERQACEIRLRAERGKTKIERSLKRAAGLLESYGCKVTV